jgi:lipopolysaccharide export system permease protein
MCILDRYIIKSIFLAILSCILLFCFLYIIIDIFGHLDEIIKQKIAFSLLIDYYLAYLPIIFTQITPIACLISTLYVLGSLCRHNEIIAMRSAGISTFKIIRGVIILSILASMFVFVVNEKFVPDSTERSEKIKNNILKGSKKEKEFLNLCIYGSGNRLFFINRFSLEDNTIEGITILQEDKNQNITQKIVAQKGVWQEGNWKFYETIIYNFDETGQIKGDIEYHPSKIMDISETPQDFLKQKKNPQLMSIGQMKKYILRLLNSSAKQVARNLEVDLYHRLFFPFSSLVITIIGIPFALRIKGRVSAFSSFGISLVIGFLYYVMDAVSVALGKIGIFAPLISAGSAHIFFLCIGLYLIYKS